MKVAIIGAGNVGTALATSAARAGWQSGWKLVGAPVREPATVGSR